MARGLITLGNNARAIGELRTARSALVPIVEKDPESTTYRYDLGIADRLLAQAYFAAGDRAKALERIGSAIATFEALRKAKSLRESDAAILTEMEAERARYTK